MMYHHQHNKGSIRPCLGEELLRIDGVALNVGDTILSGDFGCAIHPGRLTWNLQITHLERKIIITFQTPMIMF